MDPSSNDTNVTAAPAAPAAPVQQAMPNTTPELMASDIVGGILARANMQVPPSGEQPQPVPVPNAAPPAPQPVPVPNAAPQVPQPVPASATVAPTSAPQPADLSSRFSAPDPNNVKPEFPSLPEVPQEPQIQEPQNMGDSARHSFAALRAQVHQFRDIAEKYRKEVESVRTKYEDYSKRENTLAEQLTAEQKRNHDLEEDIGKLDLTRSNSFRQQYDVPLQAKQEEIRGILVSNGIQEKDAAKMAEDIMMSEDKDVPGLVANLPTIAQGMVMVKHNEANQMWADRNQAIENWRTTQTGLSEVTTRADAVARAQHRSELANTALERISGVDTMRWDAPEFVARRNDAIEKAKAWYQTAPEDQIATAAMEGVLAPFAYERISALEAQVQELSQKLAVAARMRNPTVTPYYPGVQMPPAPPPRPAPAQQAQGPISAMDAAEQMVRGVLMNRM